MTTPRTVRDRLQRCAPALLVAGALTLSACSGGSSASTTDDDKGAATTDAPSGSDQPGTSTPAGPAVEATALLAIDADAPDGFTMVTARCDATDAAAKLDDALPAAVHRSPIVFAAPDAWSIMGSGSGGSGSVTGTDADVEFDLESGDRVTVGYEWDSHTVDGDIADFNGEPWTSFDYDVTTADDSTEITYEKVATVTNDGQEVDLYYRDPAQAPDDLSTAQYKARINVAELPKAQLETDEARVHSIVATVEVAADAPPIAQDDIETIISSFSMPTCTWETMLQEQELALQIDLDGDGKIRSAADVQKELQDQLDDLEQQVPDSGN